MSRLVNSVRTTPRRVGLEQTRGGGADPDGGGRAAGRHSAKSCGSAGGNNQIDLRQRDVGKRGGTLHTGGLGEGCRHVRECRGKRRARDRGFDYRERLPVSRDEA